MTTPPLDVPRRITTARLLLRAWEPADEPRLRAAIAESLDHLRKWMPWAMDEPSPSEVLEARLRLFDSNFSAGTEWLFGIFSADDERLLGGIGLHRRDIIDGFEIGYWVHVNETGNGIATEATGSLTHTALALPGVERIQIRCDPANVASAAIPRRLGFSHIEALIADAITPAGEPRATMVWELCKTRTATY